MDSLSRDERDTLRTVARDAIHATLTGSGFGVDLPEEGSLARPGSCFVTIRRRGRLRGCIGLIGDRRPLARAVREAASRSLSDPRFPGLTPAEGEDLDLEITAIFLPQVATEQGWDRERLLTELARKAGLPGDAWRHPKCELSVFEADVF